MIGILIFSEFDTGDRVIVILDRVALLLQSSLCIIHALGLLYRKAWGLKLTYINCLITSFGGLYIIVTNDILQKRLIAIVLVLVSYGLYLYFKKKKHMFIN